MLYRRSTLIVLLALIFLAFFGTLALSAGMFPQNYDWRYRVISNLLSPRDNPSHCWLPACGIIFAAVLMLPFAGYLHRNLEIASPLAACISAGALVAGIIALICACLVVPQHVHDVLGIRRLHEFIARSAAGLMAIGMLSACWCAWKGFRKNFLDRRLFWSWSLVTLLPLAGIFVSESLLALTRLKPERAMPIRNALRHSVFWHLGFWEWLGSAAVFVFLCAAVFLTPSQVTQMRLEHAGRTTAVFAATKCRNFPGARGLRRRLALRRARFVLDLLRSRF
jgi:sorbitol-specific phosphotransferase system component IIC